jgi:WD40 repeat protein
MSSLSSSSSSSSSSYGVIQTIVDSVSSLADADPSYLFQLAISSSTPPLLAAVTSEHVIKLYKLPTPHTTTIHTTTSPTTTPTHTTHTTHTSPTLATLHGTLREHKATIRDAVFDRRAGFEHVLYTCSDDRRIIRWDCRDSRRSAILKIPSGSGSGSSGIGALALNGHVLAAASGTNVYFWDLQSGARKAAMEDFHSDIISTIGFHPLADQVFFSGGDDTLLNVFHLASGDFDEDLNVVISVGQAIHRFGFFGPQLKYLYCITLVETLSLWDASSGDMVVEFKNVRDTLSKQLHVHIHTLVNCHADEDTGHLYLLVSTADGDMYECLVNKDGIYPRNRLPHVHNALIRDAQWYGEHDHVLITAGEDSKLVVFANDDKVHQYWGDGDGDGDDAKKDDKDQQHTHDADNKNAMRRNDANGNYGGSDPLLAAMAMDAGLVGRGSSSNVSGAVSMDTSAGGPMRHTHRSGAGAAVGTAVGVGAGRGKQTNRRNKHNSPYGRS